MTAIDPTTSAFASATQPPSTSATNSNGMDENTFLKLLVAQMQYQDPLNPTDGTQFISQSAEFAEVEKLTEIEKQTQNNALANEVLEAGSMIGKQVSVVTDKGTPAATTVATLGGTLPADAASGTKVSTTQTMYTSDGTAVPLRIDFTKQDDGADGSKHWSASVYLSTTLIHGPENVDFNSAGERTSGDITLSKSDLEKVPGTTGKWTANGIRLDLGASGSASRVRVATGPSSFAAYVQNGTDGKSMLGIVTGVRFTANGPLLTIGGNEYALANVSEVHVSG